MEIGSTENGNRKGEVACTVADGYRDRYVPGLGLGLGNLSTTVLP